MGFTFDDNECRMCGKVTSIVFNSKFRFKTKEGDKQ